MLFLFRDTLLWAKAVDLMRNLRPKLLVPQHTRPVEGQEEIEQILTAYRDAIQVLDIFCTRTKVCLKVAELRREVTQLS